MHCVQFPVGACFAALCKANTLYFHNDNIQLCGREADGITFAHADCST